MNVKFDWSRRSFVAVLGGLFAPAELNAAGLFGKKPKPSMPSVGGDPIVPSTTGLGSTGDIYAELGSHLSSTSMARLPSSVGR